jgi:DNA-binding NarL/FixJ family response regulator
MAQANKVSCLARVGSDGERLFGTVLAKIGLGPPVVVPQIKTTDLAQLKPDLLVVDLDLLEVDPLEALRRVRFVLPTCVIAVYTDVLTDDWALKCHSAGANCLLSKDGDSNELALGLRWGQRTGCFTDPDFSGGATKIAERDDLRTLSS